MRHGPCELPTASGSASMRRSNPGSDSMPRWTRSPTARLVRAISHTTWIRWFTYLFAELDVRGLENLAALQPPVIFAASHESHFDTPVLFTALPARWRSRLAPVMLKDFFHAYFHPEQHSRLAWLGSATQYFLATLLFGAFPLPQSESGLRTSLRYAAELVSHGWCLLIYPEGQRNEDGTSTPFQPGVALLASRLKVPVVPVLVHGTGQVLPKDANMLHRGRVQVRFGKPLRVAGKDYTGLAGQIEEAVRAL